MSAFEPHEVLIAACLYWSNENPIKQFEAAYGRGHTEDYIAEKLSHFPASMARFFFSMDYEHQQRYVRAALARYGAEAVGRVAVERAYNEKRSEAR